MDKRPRRTRAPDGDGDQLEAVSVWGRGVGDGRVGMGVKQRSAIRTPNRGPESHNKEHVDRLLWAAGGSRAQPSPAVSSAQQSHTGVGPAPPLCCSVVLWYSVERIFNKKSSENTPSISTFPSGTQHHRTGRTLFSAEFGLSGAPVLGLICVWASWLFLVFNPGCLAICLLHGGREEVRGRRQQLQFWGETLLPWLDSLKP